MTLKVPQHIRQRLVAVIDDLKNAVGQEAAKAYLMTSSQIEADLCYSASSPSSKPVAPLAN